ncbi:MAG: DUF99 family protein [Desulfobacterales bacterium]|nr:DUF99 family protein [Desulfobacterales bacterium]
MGRAKNKRFSNVIGFDDAPFPRNHRGMVKVVGAVFARLRFDGVLVGEIEKDGFDAAEKITSLVARSKFAGHIQLIMLQGIALGGFNVIDVFHVNERLGVPVLVVSRVKANMAAIRNALLTRVRGGEEKWAVIEKLGPLEPAGSVHVQRVGLTIEQARAAVERFAVHGNIPEPIRAAHLIAGAIENGESRGDA